MGDYLRLQWLQARRGLIFCVVLVIWTLTKGPDIKREVES